MIKAILLAAGQSKRLKSENKLIKKAGKSKDFSFKIKSHVDLGL